MSECRRKGTFDFNETVNNHGLKRGTVCWIVWFIRTRFPEIIENILKIFENIFIDCSDALKVVIIIKNRPLDFWPKYFGEVDLVLLVLKMQPCRLKKTLINDRFLVSKESWNFHIPTVYNFALIYPWNLLFS